ADDRTILVIVKDPDNVKEMNLLKSLVSDDLQKLLDDNHMKLFFMKLKSFDEETGKMVLLDGSILQCIDEEDMCDCGSCNCSTTKSKKKSKVLN
ncbi:MAG TPA: hypothetical protein VMX17_07685, partial [Candidatus Glassbacteria bacterium]|nr:hypothetical protein [Candidatus Glassbacteria bacterium]